MSYFKITSSIGIGIWNITDEGLYRVNNDKDFMKEISYEAVARWNYRVMTNDIKWDVITEDEAFLEMV